MGDQPEVFRSGERDPTTAIKRQALERHVQKRGRVQVVVYMQYMLLGQHESLFSQEKEGNKWRVGLTAVVLQ